MSGSGAIPVLLILTPHPTRVNGFDFGTGRTALAPEEPARGLDGHYGSALMETHMKRSRGPKAVWPLTSLLTRTVRHLPHWAHRFKDAVDRAAFETTVDIGPSESPPPTGVREPRRPKPANPTASRALHGPHQR